MPPQLSVRTKYNEKTMKRLIRLRSQKFLPNKFFIVKKSCIFNKRKGCFKAVDETLYA